MHAEGGRACGRGGCELSPVRVPEVQMRCTSTEVSCKFLCSAFCVLHFVFRSRVDLHFVKCRAVVHFVFESRAVLHFVLICRADLPFV